MLLSKFEAENPFFKRYCCILFLFFLICMFVCLFLLKRVVRRVEKVNKAIGRNKAVL